MVSIGPSLVVSCLLAYSKESVKTGKQRHHLGRHVARISDQSHSRKDREEGNISQISGRKRYTKDGSKKKKKITRNSKSPTVQQQLLQQQRVTPLPPITDSLQSRPSYFTCRHTYEETLMNEIQRFATAHNGKVETNSPYPGLVSVKDSENILPMYYDPIYALQSMPCCAVVSGQSIKSIAKEIHHTILGKTDQDITEDEEEEINTTHDHLSRTKLRERLHSAPRGSLSIHGIVPGMCKGQVKPHMQHRCEIITEEILKMMKTLYPAARKSIFDSRDEGHVKEKQDGGNVKEELGRNEKNEKWILQVMLQGSNIAVASLIQSQHIGPGMNAYWPNINEPLGLSNVDISDKMPSSAYRKLMEALECMKVTPSPSSVVYDLGASPGGWTTVLTRLGLSVVAVDRSELDRKLMKNPRVDFVAGDAFTFEPNTRDNGDDCWMVSDVIAYPDRCIELIGRWCARDWAKCMIVTMKFQGVQPSFDHIDEAISLTNRYGYNCRVKHFFNNKNEVTFMIVKRDIESSIQLDKGILGTSMYPVKLEHSNYSL